MRLLPLPAHTQPLLALATCRYLLPGLRSNSPLRTPPINASHSAMVKFRVPFPGCLLSRTRMISPARPATSTQLPVWMLRELFIQSSEGFSPDFSKACLRCSVRILPLPLAALRPFGRVLRHNLAEICRQRLPFRSTRVACRPRAPGMSGHDHSRADVATINCRESAGPSAALRKESKKIKYSRVSVSPST